MSVKEVIKVAKASNPKPTLSLNQKELPEIKDWKVGKKYQIVLDVEQVALEKGDSYFDDDSKQLRARFKILKARECEYED